MFKELARQTQEPKWNFNKYLVTTDGKVAQYFDSQVASGSQQFNEAVEKLLKQPVASNRRRARGGVRIGRSVDRAPARRFSRAADREFRRRRGCPSFRTRRVVEIAQQASDAEQ